MALLEGGGINVLPYKKLKSPLNYSIPCRNPRWPNWKRRCSELANSLGLTRGSLWGRSAPERTRSPRDMNQNVEHGTGGGISSCLERYSSHSFAPDFRAHRARNSLVSDVWAVI